MTFLEKKEEEENIGTAVSICIITMSLVVFVVFFFPCKIKNVFQIALSLPRTP
jgi:hypothetical protein